jgi:hypothetical protein
VQFNENNKYIWEPKIKDKPLTGRDNIKVIYDDIGEDITTSVKSISIQIAPGDVVTAKLEFPVSNVKLGNIESK